MKLEIILILSSIMILLAGFAHAEDVRLNHLDQGSEYYSKSSVMLSYTYRDSSYFKGILMAENLKPGFTYSIVMLGKPDCLPVDFYSDLSDIANYNVGSEGSWLCVKTMKNNCGGCVGADCIRDSLEGNPGECIQGYLVLDYFTTDQYGGAVKVFQSGGNSHFLWCNDDFCTTGAFEVGTYDVIVGIAEGSLHGVGSLVSFSPDVRFFISEGRGGSSGVSSFSGSSSFEGQEVVPEFSPVTALVALVISALFFFLFRRR